jgi:hypothetical protein
MSLEDSTIQSRLDERLKRMEAERNARRVEAACAECLLKRPVKYDTGLPYCVDCYPEAAGE